MVRLENYKKHIHEQCKSHYTVSDTPSRVTISDILSRPLNLPATPVKKKVAEHLVQTIINSQSESDSREGVLKVPTSGQVSMKYKNKKIKLQYIQLQTTN